MTVLVKPIKKVAIIGAGPSGLVTLKELLHTNKDGTSTIINPNIDNELASDPAFDEIVVFEQNDKTGGVWNHTSETDPKFPDYTEAYNKPQGIRPHLECPALADLETSDYLHPLVSDKKVDDRLLYSKSGVYDNLFTNIPNDVMKFSSNFGDEHQVDKNSSNYTPFVLHQNVKKYIDNFETENSLTKYIRFNSIIEKVFKKDDKWNVVVCQLDKSTGTTNWYLEKFDAVVTATGRFNIPFVPKIDGLKSFVETHPNVVFHSKAFRSTDELRNKKVLVVGLSVSAVDLLQYLIPLCKETHVSGNNKLGFSKDKVRSKKADWVERIIADDNINMTKHSRISKFDADDVYFEDGTKESNFDFIIFCTGYHIYFPFMDIPENKDENLLKISSGHRDIDNFAMTKVDNLYLYLFTVSDPTIAHIGLVGNPLFFLTAEAEAIAVAGVWSGLNTLPSKEEQLQWIDDNSAGRISKFQYFDEHQIEGYISICYKLGTKNRYNFLPKLHSDYITKSKNVLYDLFYKFSNKEYQESNPNLSYNGN